MNKVEKIIYYYHLEIDFTKTFRAKDGNLFRELFQRIHDLVSAKDPSRYVNTAKKNLFINDIGFDATNKVVWGKLRLIKDEFPELLHKETDITRDIEAAEEEGIVETSHFLIDYSKKNIYLAMEYLQSGAKHTDLVEYIESICLNRKWITGVRIFNVIQDVLKDIKKRINNFSEIFVKVSKSNVDVLKKIDNNLFNSVNTIQNHFDQEYAEVRLKFEFKGTSVNQKSRSNIMKIIDKLSVNKSYLNAFDTFKIKAQDSYKNNHLEAFNLLIDNISSDIKVEKKEKSRILSSIDMFDKMKQELIRIRPLLK